MALDMKTVGDKALPAAAVLITAANVAKIPIIGSFASTGFMATPIMGVTVGAFVAGLAALLLLDMAMKR